MMIIASGYVIACVLLLLIEKRMLFPVPPTSYDETIPDLCTCQDQHGREVIMRFRLIPESHGVVIYAHGNATDIGRLQHRKSYYEEQGWSVCLLEFPGYGISKEPLDPNACLDAFDAAVTYVREQSEDLPMVFHGRSLGSGVVAYAAERHQADGIILESAYRSAQRVLLPVRLFPWDYFNTQARIKNIKKPIMFIHGEADRVINISHSKFLAAQAPNVYASCWLPDIGHNDLRLVDRRVHGVLRDFLNSLSLAETVEKH